MKIEQTGFDCNCHGSQEVGNNLHGKYVLHNVDVYNDIIINGERFTAVYQTGVDYLYNELDCPSPLLELSEDGGCNRVLVLIGTMYEKDFEDSEILTDILSEIKELTAAIKTVKDIYTVWDFLRNNKPDINDFIKNK